LWPEIDEGKYGQNIGVYAAPLKISKIKNKYIRALRNLCMFVLKLFGYALGIFNKSEKIIQSADLVISCGGGYMQCRGAKQFIDGFVYHAVQLECARRLKKKYIIFAQTVGPFSASIAKRMEPIFDNALAVLPRENISYEYTQKVFPKANIHLTADVAFLLTPQMYDIRIDKSRRAVGITVRSWIFPECADREQAQENYISSIIDFVDCLVKSNFQVFFMPQCVGPSIDNDLIITNIIFNRLVEKKHVVILDEDIKPEELKYVYSKMDFFVGTRMHSNIFALSEGVPCLAISYDYKTDGIMQLVGMKEYVININEITGSGLTGLFRKLVDDNNVRTILKNRVRIVKRIALSNFEYI
jgi:colanic acid/amylovoran biosynthesis protein